MSEESRIMLVFFDKWVWQCKAIVAGGQAYRRNCVHTSMPHSWKSNFLESLMIVVMIFGLFGEKGIIMKTRIQIDS
jgi:hypothetical protein